MHAKYNYICHAGGLEVLQASTAATSAGSCNMGIKCRAAEKMFTVNTDNFFNMDKVWVICTFSAAFLMDFVYFSPVAANPPPPGLPGYAGVCHAFQCWGDFL